MKKLAYAETLKVGKKANFYCKVVGKLVCSEARPNEPAFKRYALCTGELLDLVLRIGSEIFARITVAT